MMFSCRSGCEVSLLPDLGNTWHQRQLLFNHLELEAAFEVFENSLCFYTICSVLPAVPVARAHRLDAGRGVCVCVCAY